MYRIYIYICIKRKPNSFNTVILDLRLAMRGLIAALYLRHNKVYVKYVYHYIFDYIPGWIASFMVVEPR